MLASLIKSVFYIFTALYLVCLYSRIGRMSEDISTIKTILNETQVKKVEIQDSIAEEQTKTFALYQMKLLEDMGRRKIETVDSQKLDASNFTIKGAK